MAHPVEESAGSERRLLRWSIGVFVVVLLLLAAYGTYRFALRVSVEAELEAIRERGEPATLEELTALLPSPPVGENAGTRYLAAVAHLRRGDEVIDQLPEYGLQGEEPARHEAHADTTLAAMAQFIERNRPVLEGLREAARYPEARYIDEFRDWIDLDLGHLGPLRHAARAMAVSVHFHVERGEMDRAVDDLLVMSAIAESLRHEPVLISSLVRVSIHAMQRLVLERMLSRGQLSVEQLARIDASLEQAMGLEPLRRAMLGERVANNAMFDRPASDVSGWIDVPEPMFIFYRVAGLTELDRLKYLELMGEVVEAARSPEWEAVQRVEEIEGRIYQLPFYCTLTRSLMPAMSSAMATHHHAQARLESTRVALAVERYRLDHDALPPDLDALVPEYIAQVPLDPFDGEPMRYRLLAPGYVVYSVGSDGIDHGGRERTSGGQDGYDLPFTVER